MKRTVSFSKDATNIFFHILTTCNLTCRHCYINPIIHGKRILDLDTIYKWLNLFAEKKRKTANVIFLGGEPTLHPDLALAVKKAKVLGYGSITIDTNGYLFNDILTKIVPDDVDFISFSLDGSTPATNDTIRGRGSFEKCTEGIRNAAKLGFSTSLIYTVSMDNIHELHQMEPLLVELGISRFFIQIIGIRGNSSHDSLQVPADKWVPLIPQIAENIAKSGITVTFPKVFLAPDEEFQCAGKIAENYFIFPNGRVYQCPICEDYPINSYHISGNQLTQTEKINEKDLFQLDIPEGCVMNKLIQPNNISYAPDGKPQYKIACCLLKEEISISPPNELSKSGQS